MDETSLSEASRLNNNNVGESPVYWLADSILDLKVVGSNLVSSYSKYKMEMG